MTGPKTRIYADWRRLFYLCLYFKNPGLKQERPPEILLACLLRSIDQSYLSIQADDDTYVIMENLVNLLQGYNTSNPLWFGCNTILTGLPNGFPQGGAGYVLSRETLERVVKQVKDHLLMINDEGGDQRLIM